MQITNVKIRRLYQDQRLKALVSVTVDEALAIQGPERLFVAMPSRRDEGGAFRDIAHPITAQAREQLEGCVLRAYRDYLDQRLEPVSEAPAVNVNHL